MKDTNQRVSVIMLATKCFTVEAIPDCGICIPSSFMQHLHQLSLHHSVRLPPGASACQPAPSLQIANPNVQAMQQLLLPHSTRLCPVACQNVAAPPVQAVQHAAALSFGTTSMPPVISAISPAGNLHFGREIHAPALHLQDFRPAAAASMHPATLPPEHHGGPPAQGYPSLSALELLMDMDHRPHIPGNHISSPLPETCSSSGLLETSYLETLGNVQGNQTSSAGVVCLSDDD
ncbi:hypothetical protein Pfo_007251 [Paulownia fortunei]|nr:hypothetical protein Pfo_007251 [Paulownia fortunei]